MMSSNPRKGILAASLFISLSLFSVLNVAADAGEDHHVHEAKSKRSLEVRLQTSTHPTRNMLEAERPLKIAFQLSDAESKKSVSGLHPLGWIVRRSPGQKAPDSQKCALNVGKLARSGAHLAPEAALNGYHLVTLNSEHSIAIYNPMVNLASANMLALIPLGGEAAAWALDEAAGRVYVALPREDRVVVVDLLRRRVERTLAVGDWPMRIFERFEDYIFIGNEGSGTVSVIDRIHLKVSATLEVGSGPLRFAADLAKGVLFVISGKNGRITGLDARTLRTTMSTKLRPGNLFSTFSSVSGLLYVVEGKSGRLTILSPSSGKINKTLQLHPGVTDLKTTEDGRFILALYREEDRLDVISAESNILTHSLDTLSNPDTLSFSPLFAYLRNRGKGSISILQVSALTQDGSPPFVHIPMGAALPEDLSSPPGVSPIAILPGGGGALVASPADKTIYYYMETGMMAPSNAFKTTGGTPLGLFIRDHSLTEKETPGSYETTTRLPYGGDYDVYFLLKDPLTVRCFSLSVEGDPSPIDLKPRPPRLDSLFKENQFQVDIPSKLRFRLSDFDSGKPVSAIQDIRVLGFREHSGWQTRQEAVHIGKGIYETEILFPRAGQYRFLIGSASLELHFGDTKPLVALVGDASAEVSE